MTEAERLIKEEKSRARSTRIRQLLNERHDATMKFMRASRNFRMSVRGLTVLHVVRPGSVGISVDPIIQEALQKETTENIKPEVLHASSVAEAQQIVEEEKWNIRIAVIETDIDYPGEGISLAKWFRTEHPEMPILIATDKEQDIEIIHKELPYVDVFLAKSMSTTRLMRIFGCVLGQD